MRYLFLILLVSCKPLIDRHDYIIIKDNRIFKCDEKETSTSYLKCKDSDGTRYIELEVHDGVILTKEE